MYEILFKQDLTPVTKLYEILAPDVARKAQAGQFVIIRIHEEGERIPLTIADFDREKGNITMVFQEVGKSTVHLGTLKEGDKLANLIGPLGNSTEIKGHKKVLCVGGGIGIAPIFPIVRGFKEAGAEVISIIGARTKELLIFEQRMKEVSDRLIITTDDGSYGHHGFVTDVLKQILDERDDVALVVGIGPVPMMKFLCKMTKEYDVKTVVSLNPIMVDATGMCGACRVSVGGRTRFCCVEGPEFDGHQVDFDELVKRQRAYLTEEKTSMDRFMGQNPE